MSVFSQVQLIDSTEKLHGKQGESEPNGIDLRDEEYRHYDGKSWKLPSVDFAEIDVRKEAPVIANYSFPNMFALKPYAMKLVLGENSIAIKENRVHISQTLSGTAALRLGAEFLVAFLGKTVYYYSDPTWDTLQLIFKNSGFKEARPYRYWCNQNRDIDFSGLLEDLNNAPEGAVIVLQPSVHNPTGADLSKDQWRQIASVMKERKLIPFFDSAFQGLGISLEEDVWAIRHFVEEGFELLCAQSFTKNCGQYNERIGNILIVAKTEELSQLVEGSLNVLSRGIYMTFAAPANRIVTRLLINRDLNRQWMEDLEAMRTRIAEARKQLQEALQRQGTPGDWGYLSKQIGWHSMTGLNEKQVDFMAQQHKVYLSKNGSLNISVITQTNVDNVAKAIHEAVISAQT